MTILPATVTFLSHSSVHLSILSMEFHCLCVVPKKIGADKVERRVRAPASPNPIGNHTCLSTVALPLSHRPTRSQRIDSLFETATHRQSSLRLTRANHSIALSTYCVSPSLHEAGLAVNPNHKTLVHVSIRRLTRGWLRRSATRAGRASRRPAAVTSCRSGSHQPRTSSVGDSLGFQGLQDAPEDTQRTGPASTRTGCPTAAATACRCSSLSVSR